MDNFNWENLIGKDSAYAYYGFREDVKKLLNELKKFPSYGLGALSKKDSERMNEIYNELELIRSGCYHDYEIVTYLVTVRRICKKCQHDDKDYCHSEVKKK